MTRSLWPFAKKHPLNGGIAPAPVQQAALEFAINRDKVGFLLEQGLAKTGTDLANFVHDLQRDYVDGHIVIAPSYLKSGWREEIELWKVPAEVVTWPNKISSKTAKKPHVFVLNYEALLQSGGKYLEEILTGPQRYSMTLDESSAIKNFNGITSKTARQLGSHCSIRRILSGTPMSQSVLDLYSQLRFIGELNGVNPYQFRNRFAIMGGYMGKQVKGVKNEGELHELLNRSCFRALKKDWWTGAPEKIYMKREFEMTARQKEAYKTMFEDFFLQVKDDDAIFANQVVHMKQKLSQISRGFVIDKDNGRVVELVEPSKNPALKVLNATLDETPGKHIIVTHHTYSTNMLGKALRPRGVAVLRGGMSEQEIKDEKYKFNNDPSCRELIGQDSVTARGHTLLGQPGPNRCSSTMFFENRYNLEIRSQIEDRNHRMGQDQDVTYTDFFCCSEDKAVVEALQRKQNLVQVIVDAVRKYRGTALK